MRAPICLSIVASLLVSLHSCQTIQVKVNSPEALVKAYPGGFTSRIIMWGKQSTFEDVELKLENPNPSDGCTTYHNAKKNRKMAYIVTGFEQCPLTNLIQNAQNAGAQAVFIVNPQETDIDNIQVPSHILGNE